MTECVEKSFLRMSGERVLIVSLYNMVFVTERRLEKRTANCIKYGFFVRSLKNGQEVGQIHGYQNSDRIGRVWYSERGSLIACITGNKYNTCTIIDLRTRNVIQRLKQKKRIHNVAFSSDGSVFAFEELSWNCIYVYDTKNFACKIIDVTPTCEYFHNSLSASNTNLACVFLVKPNFYTVNIKSGLLTLHELEDPNSTICQICFSPDENTFAIIWNNGDVTISDIGCQTSKFLNKPPLCADKCVFSKDGKYFASPFEGLMRIWDTKSLNVVRYFYCHMHAESMLFSDDSRTFYYCSIRSNNYSTVIKENYSERSNCLYESYNMLELDYTVFDIKILLKKQLGLYLIRDIIDFTIAHVNGGTFLDENNLLPYAKLTTIQEISNKTLS